MTLDWAGDCWVCQGEGTTGHELRHIQGAPTGLERPWSPTAWVRQEGIEGLSWAAV